MITDSIYVCLAKMTGRRFQEEVHKTGYQEYAKAIEGGEFLVLDMGYSMG